MNLTKGLMTFVYDYAAKRPACRALGARPSAVLESNGVEKLSASVQILLPSLSPSLNEPELSAIATVARFMVGATVQSGEIVNASRSTVLRRIAVVIENGYGFTPLTCGHFQISADMIQMGMAEQQLHGVERVALCNQTARRRPTPTLAAIADA
jgi:hypothetical protein